MVMNIFERELAGEIISPSDPDFPLIHEKIARAFELTSRLNALPFGSPETADILAELFGSPPRSVRKALTAVLYGFREKYKDRQKLYDTTVLHLL